MPRTLAAGVVALAIGSLFAACGVPGGSFGGSGRGDSTAADAIAKTEAPAVSTPASSTTPSQRQAMTQPTSADLPTPKPTGGPYFLEPGPDGKVQLTDEQWEKLLTKEQYRVLREAGTERPGETSQYWNFDEPGSYVCAGCGALLYTSDEKFFSACGWPAFSSKTGAISEFQDLAFGMVRTEVRCARCDGHLGHVFNDGPPPTGLRYCINSVSIAFVPDSEGLPEVATRGVSGLDHERRGTK